MITVVIADRDAPMRIGLRAILESEPEISVVAEATTGPEACDLVERLAPQVLLIGIRMPGFNGIEVTRRIVSSNQANEPSTAVIVLTTFDRVDDTRDALFVGGKAVLLNPQAPAEIVDAVLHAAGVVRPRRRRDDAVTSGYRVSRWDPAMSRLTRRQRDVLTLLAAGHSNAEIARALFVSKETVKSHLKRIFVELDVRDRSQAVIAAYERGLVEPGHTTRT